MTAHSTTIAAPRAAGGSGPLLGFRTVFRKELTEWVRGPKALIILGISLLGAVFMTLIPFIAEATGEAEAAGILSKDATANILLGWTGQTISLIAILSTMALISSERDRGTLAWSLTNPVSPASILLAKFLVATSVFVVTAFLVPLAVQIGLATVVYGAPDFRVIGTFAVAFLTLPIFYVALTVFLGSSVKSTVGVAALAFAVALLPGTLGALLPVVNELSPANMGTWATAFAKGEPASMLTPIAWLVSMIVMLVGAKLVFDRQEL
jgi:ABC-2 type transport system permease protein